MTSRLSAARARFWKRAQPATLRDALAQTKEYAREAKNLGVERIAELMGLEDHWALYKWIQTGRFPLVLLPAYEHVCGIDLATRWLAASRRKLLVDMPIGKGAEQGDLVQLGADFQHAVALLHDFYQSNGSADAEPVLAALREHLQAVAHHHFNVSGFSDPQLDFGS